MDEKESNEKVKEGQGATCESKLRACRKTGSEGSSSGMDMVFRGLFFCSITKTYLKSALFYFYFFFYPSALVVDGGESGSSNGEGKASKTEGDAGPSCSSLSSKAKGDSKSRFFDDSEESEEGEEEEEEGSDEEVRRPE